MASDPNSDMAVLTSHVLDTAAGRPGAGVQIDLFRVGDDDSTAIASVVTNQDGRCETALLTGANATVGRYRLEFHIGAYFGSLDRGFYDVVPVEFTLGDVGGHYHVPLVASPWGYSTYRGVPPSRPPRDDATMAPANNSEGMAVRSTEGSSTGAGLTTHVIDIAQGRGAGGLVIDVFEFGHGTGAHAHVARRIATAEGRTDEWLVGGGQLRAGSYEMVCHLGDYYSQSRLPMPGAAFFEVARVRFRITDPASHHHVPLLVSPWGYTTYRGS